MTNLRTATKFPVRKEDQDQKSQNPKLDNITPLCESLVKYLTQIYKPLLFYPDDLKITYKMHDFIHVTIQSHERDDGVLIGRKGNTIQSIRTLVHAFSRSQLEGIPCIIEVKDHRGSKFNPVVTMPTMYNKNHQK